MSDAPSGERRWSRPSWWLPLACVLVVVPFLGKPPVIDEESYLWIAGALDPLHPYAWARRWPPYEADAFVFAHPPLHLWWTWLGAQVASGAAHRLLAGLPWLLLLGWSAGRLFERSCAHPSLAAALWLASPVVLLGLQDTWMIDLSATAWVTTALACYREGLAAAPRGERGGRAWFVAAGLALGLAAGTKYPEALVGLALAAHMARYGPRWDTLLVAAGVVGALEGWLYLQHGGVHLVEVWSRRAEIAHGGLGGRALGALARLGLLVLPLALLRAEPLVALLGLGLGVAAVGLAVPPGLGPGELALLVACAGLGGATVVRAGRGLLRTGRTRRGDRGDGLLLGGAVLVVVTGVVLVHNYAAARYLLPAAAPAAALLTRSAEAVSGGKAWARASVVIGAVLGLGVAVGDWSYARAGAEVAHEVAARHPAGVFAAEWTPRGILEAAGWTRYRPGEPLAPGTVVAVFPNASPGEVELGGLEPVGHHAAGSFPLRVNDVSARASLYAETLGVLPLGWRSGPLESAAVYRVGPRGVGAAPDGGASTGGTPRSP